MSVESSSPWQSDLSSLSPHPDDPTCPHCQHVAQQRQAIIDLITKAQELNPSLQAHERSMLKLQMEFRVLRGEVSRAVRTLRDLANAHAKCGCCPVLVGPSHVEKELIREPFGNELVCSSCYGWLKKSKVTAEQQRKKGREYHHEDDD